MNRGGTWRSRKCRRIRRCRKRARVTKKRRKKRPIICEADCLFGAAGDRKICFVDSYRTRSGHPRLRLRLADERHPSASILLPSSEIGAQIGYGLLTMLARRQLTLGQSAILDCVVGLGEAARGMACAGGRIRRRIFRHRDDLLGSKRSIAAASKAAKRGIPGWYELTWENVENSRRNFQDWEGERLVVDAVHPLAENLERVRAYLGV